MKSFIKFLIGPQPDAVARGDVSLGISLSPYLIVGIIALILVGVWFLYRRTTVPISPRLKLLLVSMLAVRISNKHSVTLLLKQLTPP